MLIRRHTCEAGVSQLESALAAVSREVVRRRPPGVRGPDVVTPAVVADILGPGHDPCDDPPLNGPPEGEECVSPLS